MTVTISQVRPVADRILILPEKGERTERGIIIPENVRQKIQSGFVVAHGPGLRNERTGTVIEHGIEKGDRVWFKEYAGADVVIDRTEHYILRAEEVLAREPLSA